MRFYLDTNCVRQINKFKSIRKYEVYTSALSIFEIISGIHSEEEYIKRKNILKSIKNSNLNILWELPRTMMIKSFNLPFHDTDTKATKRMMDEIINSSNYANMLGIRFNLGGEDYTIETFHNHDNEINQLTQSNVNDTVQAIKKENRKRLRDIDIKPSMIQGNKELLIRNFLMSSLNTDKVDDKEYIHAVKTYFENPQLENYFTLQILLPHRSLAEGLNAGSNDGMDYQHLVFTNNIDFFVSDDKFYKRIPNYINEYLDFKFINCSDFSALIKEET